MQRRVVRYSEAFKKEVVRELEMGQFKDPAQAIRHYGIGGQDTVKRWARQYGRESLLKPLIRVQTKDEVDEVKRLRGRIAQLESVLADLHIKHLLEESYLEVACGRLNEAVQEKNIQVFSLQPSEASFHRSNNMFVAKIIETWTDGAFRLHGDFFPYTRAHLP